MIYSGKHQRASHADKYSNVLRGIIYCVPYGGETEVSARMVLPTRDSLSNSDITPLPCTLLLSQQVKVTAGHPPECTSAGGKHH